MMSLLIGCEPPPTAPVRPRASFGCSGAPEAVASSPLVPAGRVEVHKISEGPDGPHVRVVAEGAPASQVAVRIGEVLGVVTRVDRELDTIPVSIYFPDITVDMLGALLRSSRIRVSKPDWQKDHVLVFRLTDAPDVAPVETQILPLYPSMSLEQTASLFCHSAASSVGWAQVVGNHVMIADRRTNLDRFASIVERVDQSMPHDEAPIAAKH
ncbi:MAG: hypothetical protein JWO36_2812 [Myxococcales bacterium]|nr:hypothetical protein [Myxococcales bacterium]